MKEFPSVPKPVSPLYSTNATSSKDTSASNVNNNNNVRDNLNNNNNKENVIEVVEIKVPINRLICKHSVVPCSTFRPHDPQLPKNTAFDYHSDLKIIASEMYEPVSDRCVTTTIIKPKYAQDRNSLDEDYNNISNGFGENNCRDLIPPEKPPRKNSRIRSQLLRQDSCEAARTRNKMRSTNNAGDNCIDIEHINIENRYKNKLTDSSVQTSPLIPYRLRLWPRFCDVKLSPSEKSCSTLRLKCCCRVLSQWLLSQVGLTIVVIIWALLGAFAFYNTEGPRELQQSHQLSKLQNDLSVDLATELKQTAEHQETWPITIDKYMEKHEQLLLDAVSAGFGEGGGGNIWTYPGCILFAVSLLTTLGFGAPVPRTTLGRSTAVVFSAVGIPLHFLLILNMGNLGAVKLQQLAFRSSTTDLPLTARPKWLTWFPFIAIALYYLLGVVLFGFVRQRDVFDCFLFPLDFTAAGGVATVNGHVRVLYALYLEFAVTLAALVVSLIQASATRGIVDIGLKLGLLTNT